VFVGSVAGVIDGSEGVVGVLSVCEVDVGSLLAVDCGDESFVEVASGSGEDCDCVVGEGGLEICCPSSP
jgi:hypothetical protein